MTDGSEMVKWRGLMNKIMALHKSESFICQLREYPSFEG